MCSWVECVCFPLWNDLDRTSLVLRNTSDRGAEKIWGFKPWYQLEVAVRSCSKICDPETYLSGASCVSLWTQEKIGDMWNIRGRAIGLSFSEKWIISASIQNVWARQVEMHFVNELFFVCCERLDSSTGRLTLVQKTVVRTECSVCACLVLCLLKSFELMKETHYELRNK